MGREAIEIKYVKCKSKRANIFKKRIQGLMKKAHDLSILCDARIVLVAINEDDELFPYTTRKTIEEVLESYRTMDKKTKTKRLHEFQEEIRIVAEKEREEFHKRGNKKRKRPDEDEATLGTQPSQITPLHQVESDGGEMQGNQPPPMQGHPSYPMGSHANGMQGNHPLPMQRHLSYPIGAHENEMQGNQPLPTEMQPSYEMGYCGSGNGMQGNQPPPTEMQPSYEMGFHGNGMQGNQPSPTEMQPSYEMGYCGNRNGMQGNQPSPTEMQPSYEMGYHGNGMQGNQLAGNQGGVANANSSNNGFPSQNDDHNSTTDTFHDRGKTYNDPIVGNPNESSSNDDNMDLFVGSFADTYFIPDSEIEDLMKCFPRFDGSPSLE